MLCRLKILQRKQGRTKDIGFIDPNVNHEKMVQLLPADVEENFLTAFMKQHHKGEILFYYNFE